MPDLRVKFEPSLRSVSPERLNQVTADDWTFVGQNWLSFLQDIDVPSFAGGQVELQFAIVESGQEAIAVCPMYREHGLFRHFYFKHFFEEGVAEPSERLEKIARFVSRFERVLDWLRCSLDDVLYVSSPMSYRTQIAIAPDSPYPLEHIYGSLVTSLQNRARELGQPVCFTSVAEDDAVLSRCLEQAGFLRVFYGYDNLIDLSKCRSFDDYLQSFKPKSRATLRKERRRIAASPVTIQPLSRIDEHASTISELYTATYRKHGATFWNHPPEFWSNLSRHLGESAEVLIAEHEGRPIGFSLLLKSDSQQEQWLYRIGRDEGCQEATDVYFDLAFYQPIERAIQRGYKHYWVGPGGYEAKFRRGAVQVPFYSWFWMPKKRDRWFLSDYLTRCGDEIRQGMEQDMSQPVRVRVVGGTERACQPGSDECAANVHSTAEPSVATT